MLIECHNCKARVDGEVIAYHEDDPFVKIRTYLLRCPACNTALVGEAEEDYRNEKWYWPDLVRVHPKPRKLLGIGIPETVKKSIDEAEKCMQVGAFLAAAAMCGRAIEAICRHYSTKDTYLGAGLKELRDKGIIDARLYQWSEELREQRNNAAHATDEVLSAQDAEDVVTFTYAIIDYVFLLTRKFEQYQKRKQQRKTEKKKQNESAEAKT